MQTRNWNGAAAVESRTEPAQAPSGPVDPRSDKFATLLIAVYAFIVASRILEISSVAHLRIPLTLFILIALVTLGLFLQHGIRGFLDNKASFCFAALTAWVVLAFPLSEWRAASLPCVQASVQGLVVFAAVVQIASKMENWRRISAAFAYAIVVVSILSFFVGRFVDGRVAGAGTLGDPNEFALSLALGFPFLLYTAASSKMAKRIALYASGAIVMYCFVRTGSRGGLIALAAMLLVLFVLGTAGQKMMMSVLVIAGIVAGGMFLPKYLKDRFVTFFSASDDVRGAMAYKLDADIASSEARKQLLIESIHMTFQHPLLGVGPGVFPWEAAQQRKDKTGFSGMALVTHNTYTQYSSETGLLGFIFWAGTLFFCIKYTVRIYRKTSAVDKDLARAARDTLVALVGLAVGSLFLSLGYGLRIPILLGLAVALHNVAKARASNAEVAETTAAPGWIGANVSPPAALQTKRANPLAPRRPGRADLSGRPRARHFD